MKTVIFSCFLLAALLACGNSKSYEGSHMLSMTPGTEQQLTFLLNLQRTNKEVVFLIEPSMFSQTCAVVPFEQKDLMMDNLTNYGINVNVLSTDLQANIDAEKKKNLENLKPQSGGRNSFTMFHNVYYNFNQVNEIMEQFESCFPTIAKKKQMRHNTEGNNWPVYYMELGSKYDDNPNSDKPVIIIEGLAHAREWITTASLIYVMHQMLEGYVNGNAMMVDILKNFTWIIIPVLNPDGYDYTWTEDRFWRKNRKPFEGKSCVGVDLNRNFDVVFGSVGVEDNCDSDVYHGERAFSESETRNVRDLFLNLKTRVAAYLSVHSFSQLVLYPWGYASPVNIVEEPSNLEKLVSVGEKLRQALSSQGASYRLGTAYSLLQYASSGGAEDWALTTKPDIYAYCYELRPRTIEDGHFMPDTDQIVPTGKEVLTSLLELAKCISEDRNSLNDI